MNLPALVTCENVYVTPYDKPWVGGIDYRELPNSCRIKRGCGNGDFKFDDEFKPSDLTAKFVSGNFLYGGSYYNLCVTALTEL